MAALVVLVQRCSRRARPPRLAAPQPLGRRVRMRCSLGTRHHHNHRHQHQHHEHSRAACCCGVAWHRGARSVDMCLCAPHRVSRGERSRLAHTSTPRCMHMRTPVTAAVCNSHASAAARTQSTVRRSHGRGRRRRHEASHAAAAVDASLAPPSETCLSLSLSLSHASRSLSIDIRSIRVPFATVRVHHISRSHYYEYKVFHIYCAAVAHSTTTMRRIRNHINFINTLLCADV